MSLCDSPSYVSQRDKITVSSCHERAFPQSAELILLTQASSRKQVQAVMSHPEIPASFFPFSYFALLTDEIAELENAAREGARAAPDKRMETRQVRIRRKWFGRDVVSDRLSSHTKFQSEHQRAQRTLSEALSHAETSRRLSPETSCAIGYSW